MNTIHDEPGFEWTGEVIKVEPTAEELKNKENQKKMQDNAAKFLKSFDELNPEEKEFAVEMVDSAWYHGQNEIRKNVKGQKNVTLHLMTNIIDGLPPYEVFKLRNKILEKNKTQGDLKETLIEFFPEEAKK